MTREFSRSHTQQTKRTIASQVHTLSAWSLYKSVSKCQVIWLKLYFAEFVFDRKEYSNLYYIDTTFLSSWAFNFQMELSFSFETLWCCSSVRIGLKYALLMYASLSRKKKQHKWKEGSTNGMCTFVEPTDSMSKQSWAIQFLHIFFNCPLLVGMRFCLHIIYMLMCVSSDAFCHIFINRFMHFVNYFSEYAFRNFCVLQPNYPHVALCFFLIFSITFSVITHLPL